MADKYDDMIKKAEQDGYRQEGAKPPRDTRSGTGTTKGSDKTANRSRARRGGGGGGGSSGNSTKDMAANYGWSAAFLNSHPNLKKVFNEAIDNNWSSARFIAEIQDTQWFKQHADAWRQGEYLKATDPQTYSHRVGQIRTQIRDAAGALGIEVSSKTLHQWAEQALRFGWTDAQINNHLASQVQIMGKHDTVGGELASTQDQLMAFAKNNAVNINDQTMQNWLRAIVRGDSTFGEYKQYITKMAVAAHPNWKQEIEGGMTLADIAQPYTNAAAQLLELNPDQIDVNDRMIREALSMKDDKGNYKSMSLYDFEDRLRQDSRWQKTDNAKQKYMDTGSAVLKMFGLST